MLTPNSNRRLGRARADEQYARHGLPILVVDVSAPPRVLGSLGAFLFSSQPAGKLVCVFMSPLCARFGLLACRYANGSSVPTIGKLSCDVCNSMLSPAKKWSLMGSLINVAFVVLFGQIYDYSAPSINAFEN